MALQATIEAPSGVESKYWRITSAHIDYAAESLRVEVSGYASKEAREAGKAPVDTRTVVLCNSVVEDSGQRQQGAGRGRVDRFIPEPSRAAVYVALKALPDFANANATDV